MLGTARAWDAGYSAVRICSCDTGLDVWNTVSQGRLEKEVWSVLERELWRERFFLLLETNNPMPARPASVTILLSEAERVQPWVRCLIRKTRSRTMQRLSRRTSRICRPRPPMPCTPLRKRQRKMCPTSSVALCRDRKPDRASVPISVSNIDRISLTSVWSFKRHRKQNRLAERRTDQRQQELPVPMIDLSPLLRQTQEKCRKSSVLSRPTRYIPSRQRHSLSRSVRLLQNLLNLYCRNTEQGSMV